MKTVIIKYNAGNIQSVLFALERIGCNAIVSDDPEIIKSADRVILPGVGEANTAMENLKSKNLDKVIVSLQQPFLGLCLGMQLLGGYSEENDTNCLNILPGLKIRKFNPGNSNTKVPHIGWNSIHDLKSDLFANIPNESYTYFVHSYYADLGEYTIATTDYIQPYSSGISKNNFYGVQFHPEKSGDAGDRILNNFLSI